MPSARNALICSVTIIEPNSAAMPEPTRPASISAVSTGPSSLIIDALTSLPNRVLLRDRVIQSLAAATRAGTRLALLFLDLDRFKQINDTLGHHTGDLLLIEAGRRLRAAVRASDTVARLGGDEFVILLEKIADPQHVTAIVRKLHDLFQHAMQIGGHELLVHASMGVSIFPRDGKDADELIQNADQAMYNSKKEGRNTFSFHSANPEGTG